MRDDLLIPIVFPEYLISVPTPRRNVDFLPWFEFDDFSIPATKWLKKPALKHRG
ncbi:hypothetical protein ACJO2E_15200 [Marinobacter sp. M1N3S26]|uniref:hypothetical protein n=1 Tax=Marinobacter sp. M1N3S26 TaxID=3382299 RepID=UPI00387B8262